VVGYGEAVVINVSSTRSPRFPIWKRLGASCLVLTYLFAATTLAPLLTLLLAAGDPSHHATVQETEAGVQIVLQHDRCGVLPHHHSLAARALTFFAPRPSATQPNHVLQFTSGVMSLKATSDVVLPAQDALAPQSIPPAGNHPFLTLSAVPMARPRPTSAASAQQLRLRSTVLLI
jgi:hypothetical protein